MNTSQQIVLITGANKGLGLETARRLGALGWRILLGARDPDRGTEAVGKLAADGIDVSFVPIDVTSDASVAAAVQHAARLTDHLDVLINNAGIIGGRAEVAETGPEHLQQTYEVNVYGPVRVTRAFLPLLHAADNPRVVMVSSGMGSLSVTNDPDRVEFRVQSLPYSSSKAALNMITSQYAKAIGDIKFNLADPGYTATDLNNHGGSQTVTEGTDAIVQLATLDKDGPTGVFIDRNGPVAW